MFYDENHSTCIMHRAYDATLTLSEKNEVFRWLEAAAFRPTDFRWEIIETAEPGRYSPQAVNASKLVHKATDYFFIFGAMNVAYSPGLHMKIKSEEHMQTAGLKQNSFAIWLHRLRQEVDAPDLWAVAAAEQEIIEAGASDKLNNKGFSRAEKRVISTRLTELKSLILESQPLDQQRADFVDEQLRYLRDASDRLGRKDWINIAISTLLNIGITVLMDGQKRNAVMGAASEAFRWMWSTTHMLQQ